ncbi:ATP-binding cassette domain-containing protein [Rhizobiales bacterium RZME27]|uniref:ATP-binding cassette domain-containing protein n=1 Tax=Endobacterium cereale TaxID=2663029 RepID=A0A6A8A6E9_9HYPH|nr:SbmA/BacA-like family transporter [Endobacterium cereale]MEB2847961.1 SbmA/BacA-like family transporter [Endobacterium cereale]MQY46703.1 ATP-binding cassette domain-containing protein [Endobacterium cereale]
MVKILAQFVRLLRPCVKAPGGKATLTLVALAIALNLGSVYASLRLTKWTGEFYSAVEKVNAPEVVRQIGIFAIIVALNSCRGLAHEYLRKVIEIRWRRSLTQHAIEIWTRNKAYWHLANSGSERVDNPDQRIADDCRLFTKGLLGEALDLIGEVVGLFSYVALLWSLASFPLSLAFAGLDMEIPRYMVWAAFIYVAISSAITHILGKPLQGLMSGQQKREASFRFSMARWRTSFDEVALAGGEAAERRIFEQRFEAVVGNWRKLIRRELILGCFTYPFRHSVLRIPLFVALPGYLAGHVAFGGLMQLSMAFSNVVTTLSWFIFSYRDLADLVATSARLDTFLRAAERAGAHAADGAIAIRPQGRRMALHRLRVRTPHGRELLALDRLDIEPGETVWLQAPSGTGKTTLAKTLAGLWPHADGEVFWPREQTMFLSQKAYCPIGTLADAVAYPHLAADIAVDDLRAAIDDVGLAGLPVDHPLASDDGSTILSGGEMQRLVLARVLLHRPETVILDEATSALDPQAETMLLATLRRQLPTSTFVIIAHRRPTGQERLRTVTIMPTAPSACTPTLA